MREVAAGRVDAVGVEGRGGARGSPGGEVSEEEEDGNGKREAKPESGHCSGRGGLPADETEINKPIEVLNAKTTSPGGASL